MKTLKSALAAVAIFGFVLTPGTSYADDPVTDTVQGVGCAVVTIVTLPIKIITGGQPGCQ
jgi:hypothetical protein